MTRRVASMVDGVVADVAHGVSRRRMFRNAGGAALGFALATAYRGPEHARADADAACGPSPMCPGARCNGWNCRDDREDTRWRPHGGAQCHAYQGLDWSCWFGYDGPNRFRCCDCCCKYIVGGGQCFGCPGHDSRWDKCICGAPA